MKRILLIEDSINYSKVMTYHINEEGCRFRCCTTGNLALDYLRRGTVVDFTVVISDFKMGRTTGLRVAKTALTKNPPIPVIMLTAFADGLIAAQKEGFWSNSWGLEPSRIFTKPVDEAKFISAIRNLKSTHSV